MLFVYSSIFIILGLIGLINFTLILIKQRSFINIPHLNISNSPVDILKYQAFVEVTLGLLFILYGSSIHLFTNANIISHLLFLVISAFTMSLCGHAKFFI